MTPLITREDDLSLVADLIRRRWRGSATLGLGLELAHDRLLAPELDRPVFADPRDRLLGGIVRLGYADYRQHPFSISREDGVALSVFGRKRWELDPATAPGGASLDRGYHEVIGVATGYRAIAAPGFASHVAALRLAGIWRAGEGAGTAPIGGAAGGDLDTFVGPLGGFGILLPVRGFDEGVRRGTRAWAASAEYRLPLALIDRGWKLLPLYLDRLAGTVFIDAGGAWCTDAQRADRRCRDPFVRSRADTAPIASTGAELALDAALFFETRFRLRGGVAFPVRGPRSGAVGYLRFGHAF